MKNGFSTTIDKILRRYGLKTRGCIGTVWSGGSKTWLKLLELGYMVERGITKPDYDYIILSKEKSTLDNLLLALTRVKTGCIIVFRADGIPINKLHSLAKTTGSVLSFYFYNREDAYIGVLFKTKGI